MVLQDKRSVFSIDVFEPWTRTVPPLWGLDDESRRVVCDHLRSSIVVIGDGVRPSNTGRGYVLRRLLRRVLTTLWRDDADRTLSDLPVEPVEDTLHHFGQSSSVRDVRDVLIDEERRFSTLLRRGRLLVSQQRYRGPLTEDDYRYLHDTHGLPRDLVQTLLP
jgi:alanyl-tRNA synthetase